MNIYLDIETIPSRKRADADYFSKSIRPPGNMSKPETIAAWERDKKPDAIDEAMLRTSLNGTYGEILVIGWAVNDEEPQALYREHLDDPEYSILTAFWASIAERMDPHDWPTLVIGHNVKWFDLRFLHQRSMKHAIRPAIELQDPGSRDVLVHDTMLHHTWSRHEHISLDELCRFHDISGKPGDIDGSKVWSAFREGRILEIVEYCKGDVERARQIYKRQVYSTSESPTLVEAA